MAVSRRGGTLPPRLPQSKKNGFVARHMSDGRIVLSAWPKKRKAAKSGWPLKQQLLFGWVARNTKILEPVMRQTCEALARGTEYTWRDIASMCILGTYYAIELPDGTLMQGARLTNPDPQFVLDLVTQVVGSLLKRTDLGWEGLPPGADGQVLTMDAGDPVWIDPSPSGGAGLSAYATALGATNANLFASKGSKFTPLVGFKVDYAWTQILTAVGGTYFASLCEMNVNTITTVLAVSNVLSGYGATTNDLLFTFSPAVALVNTKTYGILFTRSDATTTTSAGVLVGGVDPQGLPVKRTGAGLELASKLPAATNVCTGTGSTFNYGLVIEL